MLFSLFGHGLYHNGNSSLSFKIYEIHMPPNAIQTGSLVLYKIRPAVVTEIAEKITIKLEDNKAKRVRDKDVTLLHPGPVTDLDKLGQNAKEQSVSVEEAWELLEGEEAALADLSELLFDEFTPESAWAAWQTVFDGVYFEGKPQRITTRNRQQIDEDLEKIRSKQQEEAERKLFFEHIGNASLDDNDRKKLSEVEMVALGKNDKSNILRTLDVKQSKESAHQFLINCGYWEAEHNPFPQRAGIEMEQPGLMVPELPDEQRLDLTGLDAYAIDDAESTDPDDAISLDGEVFWVHVADVAALVKHGSDLDLEARSRASNLYLPEGLVHMLPETLTHKLGLGLNDVSPALSIGFRVSDKAEISDIKITPSLIKAKRLSYKQADELLETQFSSIKRICDLFRQKRLQNNAAEIDLPEASVSLSNGEIHIRPFEKLGSRQMITDAMLMAGLAVARFCMENSIPIPYATQPEPEEIRTPEKTSEMFAYRRLFKASKTSLQPEPHFGLGLEVYTRVTSPLRRYMDLAVHQQLRAFLAGESVLSSEQLSEKFLNVDQQSANIRRTERFSNIHWKLVFLKRNPRWQGEAVIVDVDERKSTVIIPELAMETKIRTRDSFGLDDTIRLQISGVDLPEQTAFFQYLN